MAAAAILKSTLPVEPPSREMNSLFVIFNQKCNFYCGILMLKGSLLSGALMLKRYFYNMRAIRTKIATCGLAEETEKKTKKAGEESHKFVIFHHLHVEAPFRN